jgi:hypothetical protein
MGSLLLWSFAMNELTPPSSAMLSPVGHDLLEVHPQLRIDDVRLQLRLGLGAAGNSAGLLLGRRWSQHRNS